MSCPGITRLPSMRKVVSSTFISAHLPVPFSACSGRVFTLHFARYRLAGRPVFFSITIWALLFLVLHGSFGVPLSQYIDDRHLSQLLVQLSKQPWDPSFQNAEAAAYILCLVLVEAGYFVSVHPVHVRRISWLHL